LHSIYLLDLLTVKANLNASNDYIEALLSVFASKFLR